MKSFDATDAKAVKGVVDVVEYPKGVAVLATNTYAAKKGRDALVVEWDNSEAEMRGSDEIIADYIETAQKPGASVEKKGDSANAIGSAAQTFEATFVFPYLAHACMEPLDYVIEKVGDGKYHVTAGTQMQSVEQGRIAKALGVPPENVTITTLFAGGGFGRRGNFVADLDVDSAMILKASGEQHPIKLAYTREDDIQAGYYRPMFVHKMRGAIDDKGNITRLGEHARRPVLRRGHVPRHDGPERRRSAGGRGRGGIALRGAQRHGRLSYGRSPACRPLPGAPSAIPTPPIPARRGSTRCSMPPSAIRSRRGSI